MQITGIMSELKGIMDMASARYVPTTLRETFPRLLPVLILAEQWANCADDSRDAMKIVEGKVVVVESQSEEERKDGCYEDASEDGVHARVEKSLQNHMHSRKMSRSKRYQEETRRKQECM